jgi:hypothetical protein
MSLVAETVGRLHALGAVPEAAVPARGEELDRRATLMITVFKNEE